MSAPEKHADPLENAPIIVAALYRFTGFDDLEALRQPLLDACNAAEIKGTLLLAHEGINGTIAGSRAGIDAVIAYIKSMPGCAELEWKESFAAEMPFYRMKVRLKKEIVTLGVEGVDPVNKVGTYVTADKWNDLISQPDVVVIDTRNDYEVKIGSFEGALNPETATFRDFPAWFRQYSAQLADADKKPRIAMFCTGGIRCEKSTAFLRAEGFDDVYHLEGGILKYLETVPEDKSLWRGECFVFDQRVSVGHGLALGSHGICHACRMPLSPAEMLRPEYVEGQSCPHCHDVRGEDDRARYAERHRQSAAAMARGEQHLGALQGSRTEAKVKAERPQADAASAAPATALSIAPSMAPLKSSAVTHADALASDAVESDVGGLSGNV